MNRNYPLAILMVLARTELERDNATRAARDARRERDELVREKHEYASELARMRLAVKQAKVAISRIGELERFERIFDAAMRGEK
jgi:hypothetical protein